MSFQTTLPVAKTRKAGHCSWCGQRIQTGEASVREKGMWEGDFFRCRYHPECWRAAHYEWNDYEFPEPGTCARGRVCENGEATGALWPSFPVTSDELHNPARLLEIKNSVKPQPVTTP